MDARILWGAATPCREPELVRGGVPTVPSYLREMSAAICWNCDRGADWTVGVTLRTRSGATRTFRLCHDCRGLIEPALVALAEEAGVVLSRNDAALPFTR